MGGGPDVVTKGEGEELPAVVTGIGSDAAHFLFVEQLVLIVQRRRVGQVDPGDGKKSPTGANRIALSRGSGGES